VTRTRSNPVRLVLVSLGFGALMATQSEFESFWLRALFAAAAGAVLAFEVAPPQVPALAQVSPRAKVLLKLAAAGAFGVVIAVYDGYENLWVRMALAVCAVAALAGVLQIAKLLPTTRAP
jgi:hypothetical protein